tara:strand:+ start:196 stop:651 length:456 start_codon:yes stop_codon:yes gene_type:complete
MKILKIIILTVFAFSILKASNAGHHKMTFQYGGQLTNLNVVANDDFFSVSGSYIGTNRMTMENGDIIQTNFMCPAIFINGAGNGTCRMKDAKSEDFWILSWKCGADGQCSGDVINGTGRFEGAKGSMSWWNDSGWGEGGGTFILEDGHSDH